VHLFELSPNCSLTPRSAACFFASIVSVSLTIATVFAALGYWPVLPFAGLEMLLLGAALRYSLRRGQVRHFIHVDGERVTVRRLSGNRAESVEFARPWTWLELRATRQRHGSSRLFVGSMGRRVEVGEFLTEAERLGLRQRLAEVLAAA